MHPDFLGQLLIQFSFQIQLINISPLQDFLKITFCLTSDTFERQSTDIILFLALFGFDFISLRLEVPQKQKTRNLHHISHNAASHQDSRTFSTKEVAAPWSGVAEDKSGVGYQRPPIVSQPPTSEEEESNTF